MSVLRHDHPLMKPNEQARETGASAHVDSRGRKFGDEVHLELVKNYDWKENENVSLPIEHRHKHIEEINNEGKISWLYRPPGTREAEREIVRRSPAAVAAGRGREEDEEITS